MDRREALKNAKKYATIVKKKYEPKEVYLFGSYANGIPRADSDIDVAVLVNGDENFLQNSSWLDASANLWALTRNVSVDIEPILLDANHDPSGFVKDIKTRGIKL